MGVWERERINCSGIWCFDVFPTVHHSIGYFFRTNFNAHFNMNMYVTLSSTCFGPWHAHLQEEQLHKHMFILKCALKLVLKKYPRLWNVPECPPVFLVQLSWKQGTVLISDSVLTSHKSYSVSLNSTHRYDAVLEKTSVYIAIMEHCVEKCRFLLFQHVACSVCTRL